MGQIPAAACLGLALALSACVVAPAQGSVAATQALLDKAHALETRGRMDMAAQTWQQVLLADPKNTEALGGLARAAKLSGNDALATTYLGRLRAINPNDPGIARAESATSQPSQVAALQQAGKLAQQGNYAQAMNVYRQVFGSQPPAGDWALAYYETEAATEDGRPHAIAGFRSLIDRYPQDSRYQIALGRILTYNPSTRADGRRYLERHPNNPEAVQALRQSLIWDSQNPAAVADIRAYLQHHKDPQLEEAMRNARSSQAAAQRTGGAAARRGAAADGGGIAPASPESSEAAIEQRAEGTELNAAFAALNGKRFDEAETRFKALLSKDPQNARALAGLGYIRMNQQNFGGAISFLEQAKENGAKDPGLDKNLEVSRFYYVLSEGGVALNENDLPTAEQKYQQALQMRPTSPEALQGLGGTLMKAGQPQAAIPYFQQFVRVRSGADSWRALFMAQYQAGDAAAALATERRIPANIRTQLMRDPEYLRTLASAFSAVGRDADAQRVLRSALDLPFPAEARGLKADTQLQYASLLLQANRLDQASGLYRQVLADDANNVLAWQGLVNTEHAMHSDQIALQTVESMPPAVYDQALRDAGFLSAVASIYQSNNKFDLAQGLLENAIAQQNTTGQLVPVPLQLQLAGLYLQRNDPGRAYPIYQRVLSQSPDRVDAWRGLLTALHGSGRDQEALAQIQQIPPEVRKQLEQNVDYLQTVGQIYNGLGQPRQAMLFLNRVQQHYAAQHTLPPAEIDVQNAWLLYNGNNDTGLYRQLLVLGSRPDLSDDQRRTVQTIWASWAVRRANQASAAGNGKRALQILNAAAKSFPDNPAVVRALAGGYQRAGLPKEAVAIFKSQDMSSATASDYKTAVGAALAANDTKDAESWLRYGLNQYPKDGEMLNLAAKFEQARGDSGRAADYYKASLAALPPADPGSELAYMLNQPMPLNPRTLPSAQQPQDLATLLAPGSDATANGSGGSLAAPPPRPYLPSYNNSYGSAPVQLGTSAQPQAAPAIPQYMANPNRGSAPARSTLGNYQPPSSGGGDPYNSAVPQGSYAPPATGLANPASNVPMSYPGMSERDIPADAKPPTTAQPDTFLAQQQADQQEQVRRASALAAANASPLLRADSLTEVAARDYGAHPEGAQTGQYGNGEVYGPYVPYVAPTQQGAPAVSYSASNVDLPSQTIITEFPTGQGKLVPLHNAKSTRRGKVHHEQDDAAEAAAIRRRQSEPEIVQGNADPETEDDLSDAHPAQYGGTGVAAPGQSTRPSRLPATAPTNTQPSYGASASSGQGTSAGSNTAAGDTTTRTVTTQFPQSPDNGTFGQQYPRPTRSMAASTRRRTSTRRKPSAVASFGPGAPPIFYPSVPSALSSQPYPDLPPYNNGQRPPSDADLVARNVPPLRGGYTPPSASPGADGGPPLNQRQQEELELAQLEASYSGWVGGNASIRTRSGDPGLNRLYDFEVPFESSIVAGKTARFTIIPTGVFLTSGTLDATRYNTAGFVPYLGSISAAVSNTPSPQYSSGVGGEAQMTTQNLGLAIGYTPYQFLVANITGRFRYRPAGGPISLFAEREPVKDTQLSYAGLRDPGSIGFSNTGNIWGGVVATGGGIRLDKGNERAGLYASADYAALTGFHVLENRRIEGTGGAYFRVHTFPGIGTMNVGASLYAAHFEHNERATSYGLGGYFSPEIYFLGSVPVTFTGHSGNAWHYLAQAAVGVQTFQENNDPYFPLPEDAALQTAALQNCSVLSLQQRNCVSAYQPLNTSTGANFSVNGEASYRITDHWYAGAALDANNTNNYTQVQPTVFLRYLLKPQYPTDDYPTGLFPTDGIRPLRVP
ncbi:cellulose synthase subunit BcsC-related outer membrane protein [Terriglobus sp.]|uniref:cellulose synthase subunit BcsC-related outer membrane protein n=1 Tax=Terriglobus sp. TaxID=1889013 RepID=UPI003AFF95FE